VYFSLSISSFIFQLPAIKMLTDTNPAGRYWIKRDGTDVKEALQHSVKDKWEGDVPFFGTYRMRSYALKL
jgi:hypothetical protein